MSALQTLTPAQLAAYLAHLHFPSGSTPTLPQLVTHQLRYVPFESLSLHYSTDPVPDIDISLPALLEKTISGRAGSGRGGYCMEVNTLFGALLRTLGFEVWPTGGRVSNTIGNGGTDTSGGFMGWNHMVNVVADAGKRWLVDVGFGGDVPVSPILLVAGPDTMGVGPQRYRLQRKPLSQLVNQEIKYWILQSRESQDKDWTDLYAFNTDVEFSPEDFAVMNLATSRLSIFVGLVCCARTILVDELTDLELERNDLGDTGGAVGRMLLNGNVFKRRIAGKTGVVDVGTSEGERAAGLGKWFGIALSEEQRSGIKGRKSEL